MGTSDVEHSGSLRGLGYGKRYSVGYDNARLESTLADDKKDDTRTDASAKGDGGNSDYVGVTSGRRDDGGSSFARMSDKTGSAKGSTSGFQGKVRVCQDVSLSPDWCGSYTSLKGM